MRIDLLERTKEYLMANPEKFDMQVWYLPATGSFDIAGAILICDGVRMPQAPQSRFCPAMVRQLLGVGVDFAHRLFYVSGWDEEDRTRYEEGVSRRSRTLMVQAACSAIDKEIVRYQAGHKLAA